MRPRAPKKEGTDPDIPPRSAPNAGKTKAETDSDQLVGWVGQDGVGYVAAPLLLSSGGGLR